MQYIIITLASAAAIGIGPAGHQTGGGEMLLSGMELMRCASLEGSLEERAVQMGARLLSRAEAERYCIDHHFDITD